MPAKMPKYCSWDKDRERWVFQRRVPKAIRDRFPGPAVIREHIGGVDEAVAAAYAERRNAELDKAFRALASVDRTDTRSPARRPIERMLLDDELLPRFLATHHNRECERLETLLGSLRDAPATAWDALATQLAAEASMALDAFRQGSTAPLDAAVRELEYALSIRLQLAVSDHRQIVDAFNSGQLALLKRFQRVIFGDEDLHALRAPQDAQLPLVELWGNRATDLARRWQEQRLAAGEAVKSKTLDKYRGIGTDLDTVLGRRPLQSLTGHDLEALGTLWRGRGNGASTVRTKLGILRSLLALFMVPDTLERLFRGRIGRRRKSRAQRLPFSGPQLAQYLGEFAHAPSLSDDLHCVELMALTGAHLEEIYQLRAADFDPTDGGWTLRIADAKGTDPGGGHLKTDECTRRLPLLVPDDVFPSLRDWLTQRIASGGFLFADASQNRHGIRSAAASQRLNRILRRLFPDEHRLVLQSLRNTASRIMSRAGVDPRVRRRYLGHADLDIHERHYDPADLLDACDLLPAAETIIQWLRVECFRSPELNGDMDANVFQHRGDMGQVHLDV